MSAAAVVQAHVEDPGRLLTPGEVAEVFRVDPKTVTRWAQAGKIPSILTPGGHRRFYAADVVRLLSGKTPLGTGQSGPARLPRAS